MIWRVMDGESSPYLPAHFFAKGIGQGLPAMDVQVIHDKVDRLSLWICHGQFHGALGELDRGTILRWKAKVSSRFGLYRQENIGCSATNVLAVLTRFAPRFCR